MRKLCTVLRSRFSGIFTRKNFLKFFFLLYLLKNGRQSFKLVAFSLRGILLSSAMSSHPLPPSEAGKRSSNGNLTNPIPGLTFR